MAEKFQEKKGAPPTGDFDEGVADDAPQPKEDKTKVTVTSGIHRGSFPVIGKTVENVRKTMSGMFNIADGAIAVVNGQEVDEDFVITTDVETLNFVKASAVKG